MVKGGGVRNRGAGRPNGLVLPASPSETDSMSHPETGAARRRRLLAAVQGRPLDEAYRHQAIRVDLEAEARDSASAGRQDALLTADMLEHLRELIAAKAQEDQPPSSTLGAGAELFCSTDVAVIVPGFLASALADSGTRGLGLIWVSPALVVSNELGALQLGPYDGSEADLDPRVRIVPTGPLPILYDLLRLALEVRRYTTVIFAVDWRKDLDLAARRLAARLRSLGAGPRPVHLIAHSQGALVARRALQHLGPTESRRLVSQLVLLGPANFGSFSAALALGGGHSLLPLAKRLAVEPPQGFQQVLASMTGLYQLLPWDSSRVPWLADNDLGRPRFWKGGIDFARLDRFYGWGRVVDTEFFVDRTTLVLGDNHGTPTVGGVAFDGSILRDAPAFALPGDGTVPHSCSLLPNARTVIAAGTEHSMLATYRPVINAVLDILANRPLALPAFARPPILSLLEGVIAPAGALPDSRSPAEPRKLPADLRPLPEARPSTEYPRPRLPLAGFPPSRPTARRIELDLPDPEHSTSTPILARPIEERFLTGLIAESPPPAEALTPPPGPARSPAEAAPSAWPGGLNGSFLSCYDGRQAEPEAAVEFFRRDQLRQEELIRRPHAPRDGRSLELQVEHAGRDARLPSMELILDASNLLPFDFLRTGDRLGRAVVKIQRSDGAAGTGFLVAPGILLTNHHVLPDVATAAGATASANYEVSPPTDTLGIQHIAALDPGELFLANADLDFAFCAVQGLEFLGVVPLNRNSLNVMRSEYVNIIQHPRGRPKEVVLQDNRVLRADNVVLQYSCDTEPGSSGSPVFNNQWRLVALHHASVVADAALGRHAPDADPTARYLNEGIRLSAIATWLETSEANTPENRLAVTRLRGIFGGHDPQIGFFGALGRKAHGRNAAEVVVDSYRGGADDLDVAYWNLAGFDLARPDRLAEVARVIADMGLDLWCLAHADAESLRALASHLETNFQLDHAMLLDNDPIAPAILYRKSRTLAVTRLGWASGQGPLGATARLTTRRGVIIPFQIVPVRPGVPPQALVDAIARQNAPESDWILVGAATVLNAARDDYARAGHDPTALVSGPDGAIVVLRTPASQVDRVFASPNLELVAGSPDLLDIARDRELPRSAESLDGPRPVALRLAANGPLTLPNPPITPNPIAISTTIAAASPSCPPVAATIDDDALERKLKALLGPMLAQLLGTLPPNTST